MTLFEKSLKILELPQVLNLLAAEAVSESAKKEALDLMPRVDIFEIEELQKQTSAAKDMMVLKGSPGFYGLKDVSGSIYRAEKGGMLNTLELLGIAGLLRAAREAISYASGDDREEKNEISYLFSALRANRTLEDKITTSIIGEDEIADSASSALADIRRHLKIAADKVRQSLQKIITSPAYEKALQEQIITMRNGRYVVPVKAEQKSAVPGLVHDISATGQTLFIEPMGAVSANNEIRELQSKEKAEIDRILMALSAEAADCGDEIISDYRILTKLDLIFAKAKLSYKLECTEPTLNTEGKLVLTKARHPLLERKTAVPIDVTLGVDFDSLIITGPNTGGKTVTLKTMGLLCAMAQCGLHIPAEDGSMTPVYTKILADIGDEQSIEQSLSTFSAHMTNIVQILNEAGENTLVLFDELGAGTDPTEGAALAVSIIEYARQIGAAVAATTHYSELKLFAMTTPGVQNASCEFDVETLRPTYRLLIGIPGKSNAFAISKRLGLADHIIDDAKKRMDEDSKSFEELLENLEDMRVKMEKDRLAVSQMRRETEENLKESQKRREETAREREKAVRMAKREASDILEKARRTADDVFDELNKMRKNARKEMDWQQENDARSKLRHKLNDAESSVEVADEENIMTGEKLPAKKGDTVEIIKIGARAEVISVNPDGTLELQAGIMKITAKQSEIRVVQPIKQKSAPKPRSSGNVSLAASVAPEIDLRGMMTDEAIPVLERYIDSAQRAKLETVTVIHGKGTGALRAAVQQSLKTNKQVKSFRLGRYGEGETGVTVVQLK